MNSKEFLMISDDICLVDLVKLYMSSTSLSQLPQLYKIVNDNLLAFLRMCHAYSEIWRALKASDAGDSLEALVVWSYASEIELQYGTCVKIIFVIVFSLLTAQLQRTSSNFSPNTKIQSKIKNYRP